MRVLVLVVVAVAVAGCGGSSTSGPAATKSIAIETYRGLPPGQHLAGLPDGQTVLAVRQGDNRLALTFWGSGSCPLVPVNLGVVNRKELRVTVGGALAGTGHRICTADLGPTTSVVQLDPTTVSPGTLTIDLTGVPDLPDRVESRPG